MPYIMEERKRALLAGAAPNTAGELNFIISDLAGKYVARNGLQYSVLAQVTAALNDAKAEFERRVVAPYEDDKLRLNGDVYPASILLGEGAGSPASLAVAKLLEEQRAERENGLPQLVRRNPDTGAREVWTGDQYVEVEG